MLKINICHHDTQGLHNDFVIIENVLCDFCILNHVVYSELQLVKNENLIVENADINIFIEHIYEKITKFGKKNIYIPNIEWLNKTDVKLLSNIDLVLCKTQHSYIILSKLLPQELVKFIGFTSKDRSMQEIKKDYNICLHVKGISKYKNSQELIDTWCKHPTWPTLVVVHYGIPNANGVLHFPDPFYVKQNIIVYQSKIDDILLENLMNKCGIHICPSFSEGFGHYINEARSTGAFIVTTNGEPMKSFVNDDSSVLVNPVRKVQVNAGVGYYINNVSIENAISILLTKSFDELKNGGKINKKNYIIETENFRSKLIEAIKNISLN